MTYTVRPPRRTHTKLPVLITAILALGGLAILALASGDTVLNGLDLLGLVFVNTALVRLIFPAHWATMTARNSHPGYRIALAAFLIVAVTVAVVVNFVLVSTFRVAPTSAAFEGTTPSWSNFQLATLPFGQDR